MAKRYISKTTGESLQFPPTREEARIARFKRYKDGSTCPVCNTQSSRFTVTNLCHRCQFFKSTALHALKHADHLWDHSELTCRVEYGAEPYKFTDEVYMELLELKWQMDDDKSLIAHSTPCRNAGCVNVTSNGQCITCRDKKSPRSEAIANDEAWYMPLEPCNKCDTISLKRVNNGQCQGCSPLTRSNKSSREEALMTGSHVYIGKACVKCESDVRLTETSKCARCG